MIINTIINIVESFLFSFFIRNTLIIKQKNNFILVSSIIQFIILQCAMILDKNGIVLTILIICVNIFLVKIYNQFIDFKDVFWIIVYNAFILITSCVSLIIQHIILELNLIDIIDKTLFAIILSKILLLFITYPLIVFKSKLNIPLEIKQWGIILVFSALLIICICYIGYSIIMQFYIKVSFLFTLLLLLILLFFLFIGIISKICSLNNKNIELIKQNEKETYIKQQHFAINQIRNEIDIKEHRFFYVLFQIENFLAVEEYSKIKERINEYRQLLEKRKIFIDTGNIFFDYIVSLHLNNLILKGVKIKLSILISKRSIYDHTEFISRLTKIFSVFEKSNKLSIIMSEQSCFLVIKIYFDVDISDELSLINILTEMSKLYNGLYNPNFIDEKVLRIVLTCGSVKNL